VEYLIENDVLKEDAATKAYCWAEDRREVLEAALGKKKLRGARKTKWRMHCWGRKQQQPTKWWQQLPRKDVPGSTKEEAVDVTIYLKKREYVMAVLMIYS
jgi:hypothetical protein